MPSTKNKQKNTTKKQQQQQKTLTTPLKSNSCHRLPGSQIQSNKSDTSDNYTEAFSDNYTEAFPSSQSRRALTIRSASTFAIRVVDVKVHVVASPDEQPGDAGVPVVSESQVHWGVAFLVTAADIGAMVDQLFHTLCHRLSLTKAFVQRCF